MRGWVLVGVAFLAAAGIALTGSMPGMASDKASSAGTEHDGPVPIAEGFTLSEMKVEITSGERRATFQLYDTKAAKEFYDQLPLDLPLSNFRNAQWMFYPPEKLNVTMIEAYHDGLKGELSYYAPWGDVFMLYENFYAGDEMHRLGIGLTGIDQIKGMSDTIAIRKLDR